MVGLGNALMSDDGVGYAAVERLARMDLPKGVRVEALAGDVFGLVELWSGEPNVWLVDAITGMVAAGEIRILEHDEVVGLPSGELSIHWLSLGECLRWMVFAHPGMAAIRLRLYGVGIGPIHPGLVVRPFIDKAVSRMVRTLSIDAARWAAVERESPALA